MPFFVGKRIWLALSGGGFRAALFHYGCLKRLHELGILSNVYAVSAASGGALLAGLFASNLLKSPRDKLGSLDYDWDRFEHLILSAATTGILWPTFLLVISNACLAIGAVLWMLGSLNMMPVGIAATLFLLLGLGIRTAFVATLLKIHSGELKRSLTLPISVAILFWRPSQARWHTLHHQLYDRKRLGDISQDLLFFLAAIDLNTGREIVFSRSVAGALDSVGGLERLWAQKADANTPPDSGLWISSNYDATDLPLALAVAASSAYPPFFPPVRLSIKGSPIGNFVDGGILDNHALNPPRRMAEEITQDRATPYPSFSHSTSYVLAIDAAAPLEFEGLSIWSTLTTLKRIVDISYELQTQGATTAATELETIRNVPSNLIGLRVGIPYDYGSKEDFQTAPARPLGTFVSDAADENIVKSTIQIRTHFDRFSPTECAVLAYLGYLWIDYWAKNYLTEATADKPVALRKFRELLPKEFSDKIVDDNCIVTHLKFSHMRIGLFRACSRGLSRILGN